MYIAVIQRFQNKVLKDIVNAPCYVRNVDLHRDLNMEMVTAAITRFARKHEESLNQHVNVEAIQLLDKSALVRMLKKHQALRVSVLIPDAGELIPPARSTTAPAPKHCRLSRWAMSAEGQSIT
jgi:DNA primase large subunit